MKCDYLIVGAGLTGITCARLLAEKGYQIVVLDSRAHIGGNCYDSFDNHGILIHNYGPHIFHTNNKSVWKFLSRFTNFTPYYHLAVCDINHEYIDFPPNLNTYRQLGIPISEIGKPSRYDYTNAETFLNSSVGSQLTEKMFKGYTEKQWDVALSNLDSRVVSRVKIRENNNPYYFEDYYQGIPTAGYTAMFNEMLCHNNIKVVLGLDYFDIGGRDQKTFKTKHTIFTGCIDKFFDYRFGKLEYISTVFCHTFFDQESVQEYAQVNYSDEHRFFTRSIEHKKITGQKHPHSVVTYEKQAGFGTLAYPKLTLFNVEQYKKYLGYQKKYKRFSFLGRLGTFNYMNMDQCVEAAAKYCESIKPNKLLI